MPPVGMVETKLPVFKQVDESSFDFGNDEVNHNALAKCLVPVEEVAAWLSVHGDYQCDGVADDTDSMDCQRIGCLWLSQHAARPCAEDLEEGQRVRMDFDQNVWVIFTIHPLTDRLEIFKDESLEGEGSASLQRMYAIFCHIKSPHTPSISRASPSENSECPLLSMAH